MPRGDKRNKKIYKMFVMGWNQSEIAKKFGISRQRVNQILLCNPKYGNKHKKQLSKQAISAIIRTPGYRVIYFNNKPKVLRDVRNA